MNIESFNENTGKGWTDQEEATFASIMRIARMGRIAAIQFFRRCRSDHAKALKLAQDNYGLSDAQKAAYESTRAARLLDCPRHARHATLYPVFNRQNTQPEDLQAR